MRALKTVQFTWIFVKNRAVHLDWQQILHLQNAVGPARDF